jgi:hypothetical protein
MTPIGPSGGFPGINSNLNIFADYGAMPLVRQIRESISAGGR